MTAPIWISQSDPINTEYRRLVARSYERQAELDVAMGSPGSAIETYSHS